MKTNIGILLATAVLLASCGPLSQTKVMAEAVGTYTVQKGDSLFGIADKFGLEPQTIVWNNFEFLQGDPHMLKPGMQLTILPVDGIYYEWQATDTIEDVAARFRVDPDIIVAWPGNKLDLESYESGDELRIAQGSRLVIPGGTFDIADNPAANQ